MLVIPERILKNMIASPKMSEPIPPKIKAPNIPPPNIPPQTEELSQIKDIIDNFKENNDLSFEEGNYLYDMLGEKLYKGDYVIGPVISFIKDNEGKLAQENINVKPHLFIGIIRDIITKPNHENIPIAKVEFFFRAKIENTARTSTKFLEKNGYDLVKIRLRNKYENKMDL